MGPSSTFTVTRCRASASQLIYSVIISIVIMHTIGLTHGTPQEIQVNLQMREETPPFTRIGSITPSLPADMGNKLHFLTDSSFFSVTPSAGEVRVARLVDRERLCPEYKFCCGVVTCELEARIFVTNKESGEFAATVTLKVDIQDQNDNRPVFPSPTQTVRVSEASTPGTHISLTPATDADVEPVNQIQRYTLIEPTGTFVLDLTALPAVRLQLTRPLDRETTASYTATLEACDPGACARQTVEIQILDENDNHPKFQTNRISRQLMENVDVGNVVLHLNATDADSGERGRILYSFHGTIDPDLLDTFELVQETGEVRLKRPLAANIRSNYRFKVVACDAVLPACSGDENSTADVELIVKDINNFAPSIHAVAAGVALNSADSASSGSSQPEGGEYEPGSGEVRDGLTIMENTPPSQVAVLTVRDDDLGENARVTCMLNDTGSDSRSLGSQSRQNFILTPGAPGIYSLRTARMFDFEVEPTVSAKIVCHDFGQPQHLTSARVIVVRVLDANEFQPEFSRRVYIGRVPENAPAGMEVLSTTATDRDRGATLHYYFAPPPPQLGSEGGSTAASWSRMTDEQGADKMGVNKYFVMEPETGIVRTSQIPLDRETLSSVTLVVLVSDSKLPPVFTATTTVSIEVLDENDNAPIFVNPPTDQITGTAGAGRGSRTSKAFTVLENAPRFTRLSEQLEARDPDQGDNGRIHFSLLETYALGRSSRFTIPSFDSDLSIPDDAVDLSKYVVDQPLFRITPDGGIETLVELDREAVPTYLLKIGVHDRGAQPLASTTILRVNVLDVNDNAPVWGFPTLTDRTINLTTAMKPGSLAGRLRAEDVDSGDAGRVDFLFLGPRGEPLKAVTIEQGLLSSLTLLANPRMTTATTTTTTMTPPQSDLRQSKIKNVSQQRTRQSLAEENGYRVGPLYLNGSTGEIWIAEPLQAGTINLHLRAQDRGKPRTQTDAWLTIHVFVDPNDDASFFSLGGDGTLNITIILVMITITAIVSLFLIIGIVCVRRRPARFNGNRSNTMPDGSPSHATFSYSIDPHKEGLAAAMASAGWASPMNLYTGNQFMTTQGSMAGTVIDDGQLFGPIGANPGMMGYGAMVSPSDTASLIYVPQAPPPPSVMSSLGGGSMTPGPMDMSGAEYQSRGQAMHTFGTLNRNRGSLSGGFYAGSTACGAMSYEPHLDADSGDSGRGPSEEGNQMLMADHNRNGYMVPGHQYNTYAGYRPSSRQGCYRPGLAMDMTGSGNMLKLHALNCPGTSPGGSCACYMLPEHSCGLLTTTGGGISWAQASGMEMTDPYGNNYSPNFPVSHPLPLQTGPPPPLPPPRSPVLSGSNTGGTLRRPNQHSGCWSGDLNYSEQPQHPHMMMMMTTTMNDNGPYPESHMHYGQNTDYNESTNNGPSQDQLSSSMEMDNTHGTTGPPVRIDLRNPPADRNGMDEDGFASKQRTRLANVGLPPLATKHVNAGTGSVNMTEATESTECDPLRNGN